MNSPYLKSLRIVYFAFAMGIVFFLLVTLFLISITGPFAESELSQGDRVPFLVTLIVLTGGILLAYRAIVPKKLDAIQALPTLDRKLAAWRELCILQGALIEAPAFFAIILLLLLGIYPLIVWPVAGIALFWIYQPTRDKLIREASLSPGEIAEFDRMS